MTAANTNIAHRTTSNLPTCRSSREVVTFRICSPTVGESASLNPQSGENTGLQAPRVGRLLIVKNKDVGVDSPPPVEGASNVVKAAAPPEPTSGSAALASCSVQKKPAFKVPAGKQQVPRARPAKPPFPRSTAISVNAQHLLKLSRIDKERKRLQSTPEYCDNTRVDNVGIPVIFGELRSWNFSSMYRLVFNATSLRYSDTSPNSELTLHILTPPSFEILTPPSFEILTPPSFEILTPPLFEILTPPSFEILTPPSFEILTLLHLKS